MQFTTGNRCSPYRLYRVVPPNRTAFAKRTLLYQKLSKLFEYLRKIFKNTHISSENPITDNKKKCEKDVTLQVPMKYVKNSREVQDAKRLKIPGSAQGNIRLTALEDS